MRPREPDNAWYRRMKKEDRCIDTETLFVQL
jgi:hypothetical protein